MRQRPSWGASSAPGEASPDTAVLDDWAIGTTTLRMHWRTPRDAGDEVNTPAMTRTSSTRRIVTVVRW